MALYTSDGFSTKAVFYFWGFVAIAASSVFGLIAQPLAQSLQYGITLNTRSTNVEPQVFIDPETGLITRAVRQDGSMVFDNGTYRFKDEPRRIWADRDAQSKETLGEFMKWLQVDNERIPLFYSVDFVPSIESAVSYYNQVLVPKYGSHVLDEAALVDVVYDDVAPQVKAALSDDLQQSITPTATGRINIKKDSHIVASWREGKAASDVADLTDQDLLTYRADYTFACELHQVQDNRNDLAVSIADATGNEFMTSLIGVRGPSDAKLLTAEPCDVQVHRTDTTVAPLPVG
jgi:hypothetical protein